MIFSYVAQANANTPVPWTAGATVYPVITNTGNFYLFYIDTALDTVYVKSTDGGLTWGSPVVVLAGSTTQISVWYDRWSNISADLIHLAYTDSADHDVKYRSVDTASSDTLSAQTVIFAGASVSAGNGLSICRARGGNLYCVFNIDAGAEDGFARSTDVGGTWGARADPTEAAANEGFILMPGWASDNQDMMLFFWDSSADEISRKLYDDSANSWAETSIAGTMADTTPSGGFYPNWAAAVDITNSRNLLVAWSAADTANADLRCWHVTESAITEVTNVVLNSTDDQGFCAIGIDTDTQDWHVYYFGASDGSEVYNTSMNLYRKVSTDDGATWGSETQVSPGRLNAMATLFMCPRFATRPLGHFVSNAGGTVPLNMVFFDKPASGAASGIARLVGGGLVH